MKAIVIVGSPKENGSTSLLADKIIEGMSHCGLEITKHVLGEKSINYCLGCRACCDTKQCVQRDDMDPLISGLLEADIIVMASPSYWGDVPGQLKVFFDRCTSLCDTNPGGTPMPKGKKGFAVAVRAGTRVEENQHIIETIEHYFGHLGIERVDRLTVERIMVQSDFEKQPEALQRAHDFGKKILECTVLAG